MTTSGMVQQQQQQNLEKQMGCMAGFLQIFDRHQILTGKRLYSAKRLPSSNVVDCSSESEKTIESPIEKHHQQTRSMPSPDHLHQQQQKSPVTELRSPVPESNSKLPLPLPVFEPKEGNKSSSSSWKFCKEAPRLSLDSRATFDAAKGSLKPKEIRTNAAIFSPSAAHKKGDQIEDDIDGKQQHRSPSVIARLMGLEKLPEWESETEQTKKPELRRSASESRANNRDLLQYRFIDGVNFQLKQSQQQQNHNNSAHNNVIKDQIKSNNREMDPNEYNNSNNKNGVRNGRAEAVRAASRGIGQRKSFFDSADFFPEPKQTVSIYGEIEKRLKMRGIDEPSKDLETLKQILEALQLKGLLHSKAKQSNYRNFVYDNRSFSHDKSPIVVMKPAARSTSPPTTPNNRQTRLGSHSPRRESNAAMSPRRDKPEIERNVRNQNNRGNNNIRNSVSPTRSESSSVKSPNRRRHLISSETQRKVSNNNISNSRVSLVQSPRTNSRKTAPDQSFNSSNRNWKETVTVVFAEDESCSVSDSISTSSPTDTERSKMEDYKEGRNLLERCDKLLTSIAEMTANELQPSPVSVLDSSFYKEESSPSPVMMKRGFDFKDRLADLEDDIWGPAAISPIQLKSVESSDDCDFIYISDILRASNYLTEDSDVFLLLEKQQYLKGKDTSKVSRLQRKLIFDTINEILNRKRLLPPWKATNCINSSHEQTSLQQIWSEFQRIRERDASDDLLEVICGMLKKDLAGDAVNGWEDCPHEMSRTVLDIERLIFKDLIVETIRNLAAFTEKCNQATLPRRKLVF